jgi:hypothetical protein
MWSWSDIDVGTSFFRILRINKSVLTNLIWFSGCQFSLLRTSFERISQLSPVITLAALFEAFEVSIATLVYNFAILESNSQNMHGCTRLWSILSLLFRLKLFCWCCQCGPPISTYRQWPRQDFFNSFNRFAGQF